VSSQCCLIALRPAYVYEINAESGDVIGRCMSVDVIFEFDGGAIDGPLRDLPDPILDHSLSVASEVINDLIPVPYNAASRVTLKLFMWPDYREITITARGLSIRLAGEPRLEESPPSPEKGSKS
jgi:hypothetical protein